MNWVPLDSSLPPFITDSSNFSRRTVMFFFDLVSEDCFSVVLLVFLREDSRPEITIDKLSSCVHIR